MITKARLLRLLRETSSKRQEDVADDIGISATYLSLIEHGKKEPSREVLIKLADIYKVPFQLLIWDENDLKRAKTPKEKELVTKMNKFMEELFFLILKRDGSNTNA